MHIESIDIQNFRRMASTRIDMSHDTTLLVGANNSGKTTAIAALQHFLVGNPSSFAMTDITISNWNEINVVGDNWEAETADVTANSTELNRLMPSLDLWLHVEDDEVHRVSSLIPSLDWEGGLLGLRIALEVKNIESIYREYRDRRKQNNLVTGQATEEEKQFLSKASLWPTNMTDFLTRRFKKHFEFNYYVLDSSHRGRTIDAHHPPQSLPERATKLAENPIKSLVEINQISAQRGFSDPSNTPQDEGDSPRRDTSRLSRQLSSYYRTHLDPNDMPDETDLAALATITEAQEQFDSRLHSAFSEALREMENLGYPGVNNPRIRVASKLDAEQSLTHDSAVSFIIDVDDDATTELHLPEAHNGLGYQNLISMVFQLMRFRDKWMRVGKEQLKNHEDEIAPIHLVLIEEPEAHLHVQVQQVFAKKAYEVLVNHPDLKNNRQLSTQLIMSTHSSHISHELSFAQLRYFKRLPAGTERSVPTSTVVSLREVFGNQNETSRFVSRYLRAQHADLFFADAVIMVEGSAERMLLPNFIRTRHEYTHLNSAYITMLEINGSHSHRLKSLVQTLGIPTLVITDIDATFRKKAVPAARRAGQSSTNPALKTWAEFDIEIDSLLTRSQSEKIVETTDSKFQACFAYQTEVKMDTDSNKVSVYPSTFEDSLALENPDFFASLEGNGLTAKFRQAFEKHEAGDELASVLFYALKNGKKAEFVLDVLASEEFEKLKVPAYIHQGLLWLQNKVQNQSKPSSMSTNLASAEVTGA